MNIEPVIGNIVTVKLPNLMHLEEEYIITSVPYFKKGANDRVIKARLVNENEPVPSGFNKEIEIVLDRQHQSIYSKLRDCYSIKNYGVKNEIEVLIDDLYFREPSVKSVISYLGNIGRISEGGYLISTGKYKIKTNLNELLEFSAHHEISISISKGRIFIS